MLDIIKSVPGNSSNDIMLFIENSSIYIFVTRILYEVTLIS